MNKCIKRKVYNIKKREKKQTKRGQLHKTAKPNIKAEVYDNNKKFD